MCRVRADGIGGQDGDYLPANEHWGHVPFTVTAAGQVSKRSSLCTWAGLSAQIGTSEVPRRIQRAWACFGRYKMEIYDRPSVRLRLKVWMPKAEVQEYHRLVTNSEFYLRLFYFLSGVRI